MDSLRIDAVSERCLVCTKHLADRHRVVPTYDTSSLLYSRQHLEVGLLVNDVRPMWRHVDCADPMLRGYNVLPDIHYCVRCRAPLGKSEIVHPVFQVVDPKAQNPNDPTDVGIAFGDRIHFAHADCKDRQMRSTSPLIV
jgi:hypothetical protein